MASFKGPEGQIFLHILSYQKGKLLEHVVIAGIPLNKRRL